MLATRSTLFPNPPDETERKLNELPKMKEVLWETEASISNTAVFKLENVLENIAACVVLHSIAKLFRAKLRDR